MSGRLRDPRQLRAVSALAAGLLLVYLGALSPHLVHHLFDEEQNSLAYNLACPFFSQSEHTPELQFDSPTLAAPICTDVVPVLFSEAPISSITLAVVQPRAPPA